MPTFIDRRRISWRSNGSKGSNGSKDGKFWAIYKVCDPALFSVFKFRLISLVQFGLTALQRQLWQIVNSHWISFVVRLQIKRFYQNSELQSLKFRVWSDPSLKLKMIKNEVHWECEQDQHKNALTDRSSQPASAECQLKKATNQMISVTNSIACLNFGISKRSCRFNPFTDLISSELVNCCRRMQKLESDLLVGCRR